MSDCSELQAEMNRLAEELYDATWNKHGHGLKTAGATATAGTGGVILGGCLYGSIGGPQGCAAVAMIAAGGAAFGGTLATAGSAVHFQQASERERALQRAYNNAKSAYCTCVFGEGVSVLPEPELPPEPPDPDFEDLENLEEQLEQCMEAEAPLCEMPDEADQYTPAPDEEEDVDLVGSSSGNDAFYMGGM